MCRVVVKLAAGSILKMFQNTPVCDMADKYNQARSSFFFFNPIGRDKDSFLKIVRINANDEGFAYLPLSQVGPWLISTLSGTSSFIAPVISSAIQLA